MFGRKVPERARNPNEGWDEDRVPCKEERKKRDHPREGWED